MQKWLFFPFTNFLKILFNSVGPLTYIDRWISISRTSVLITNSRLAKCWLQKKISLSIASFFFLQLDCHLLSDLQSYYFVSQWEISFFIYVLVTFVQMFGSSHLTSNRVNFTQFLTPSFQDIQLLSHLSCIILLLKWLLIISQWKSDKYLLKIMYSH